MRRPVWRCALAALLAATPAVAQTFKCVDAAGKTTYSSARCAELGLKDSGEVRDRINVSPAYKPRPLPPAPARNPAPSEAPTETPEAASPAAPADGNRRCFTVKTPKGTATRCNEKQD